MRPSVARLNPWASQPGDPRSGRAAPRAEVESTEREARLVVRRRFRGKGEGGRLHLPHRNLGKPLEINTILAIVGDQAFEGPFVAQPQIASPQDDRVEATEAVDPIGPGDAEFLFDAFEAAPVAELAEKGMEVQVDLIEFETPKRALQDRKVERAAAERHDHGIARNLVAEILKILALEKTSEVISIKKANGGYGGAVGLDVQIDATIAKGRKSPPSLAQTQRSLEELMVAGIEGDARLLQACPRVFSLAAADGIASRRGQVIRPIEATLSPEGALGQLADAGNVNKRPAKQPSLRLSCREASRIPGA